MPDLLLPAFTGTPERNHIYNVDALTLMRAMVSESADCIVTSPPYNLRNSTGGGFTGHNDKGMWPKQPMRHGYGGLYTDDLPHDKYIKWQRDCLTEMFRLIRRDGCIFYNHKWRVQNGLLQRLGDEITAGFPVRQIIIWDRGGGINFNNQYFLPSYEVVYLIVKPDFELQPKTNTLLDVWRIPPSQKKDHPNAFPERLVENCITAGSPLGGLIIDPFMGSGTTAVVAKLLNRDYIGCDLNPEYVELARKRVANPRQKRHASAPLIDLPLFQLETEHA